MPNINQTLVIVAIGFAASFLVTPANAIDVTLNPGAVFRDCDTCPEMVVVPTGRFMMGYEGGIAEDRYDGPVHEVTIAKPIALGRFEVTVAEIAEFVAATGHQTGTNCRIWDTEGNIGAVEGKSWRDPGYAAPPLPNHPAGCLSWIDSKAYANWLTEKTGLPYRLATEAEWEYAAQAGSKSVYPWGDDLNGACETANIFDQSSAGTRPWNAADCNDGQPSVAVVGSLKPNAFGIYDMIGNVYEWAEDCWVIPYGVQPTDGTAYQIDGHCEDRIVRGGAWHSDGMYQRPSFRGRDIIDLVSQIFGARVARDLN